MEGYRQIYIDGNGPPAEATPTCKQMPSLVPIPKDKVKQVNVLASLREKLQKNIYENIL